MAKEFKTFDELIELLESRNIETDDMTKTQLMREGYYAIVNGYKDPFLDRAAMQAADAAKTWVASRLAHGEEVPGYRREDAPEGSERLCVFFEADVADFEMYEHVAVEGVPDDREEIVSVSHNVALNPMAGPYDGAEKGYTFMCDGSKWNRTKMHDLDFRLKLESGAIRPHEKDVLVVDAEMVQTYDKQGNLRISERRIMTVKKYIPYNAPEQLSIDGI